MRTVMHAELVEDVVGYDVTEPTRFVFRSPRRGGPRLKHVRAALASKGRLRFSGTPMSIFADVDPGPPTVPVVALEMIARGSADGLERAILSALSYVDEIVVGTDNRSTDQTMNVAHAYADTAHLFGRGTTELSEEEWAADKMHFARARNGVREFIQAPWSLVLDTDEHIRRAVDFRDLLQRAAATDEVNAFLVSITEGELVRREPSRLARTKFRWFGAANEQLDIVGARLATDVVLDVVSDGSLRVPTEAVRSAAQHEAETAHLEQEAAAGHVNSMVEVAKRKLLAGDESAVALVEQIRLKLEPQGGWKEERVWLALECAFFYYKKLDFHRANQWAHRSLLDGPRIESFCLLGDVCEDYGDLETALVWYEIACVTPEGSMISWGPYIGQRWGRRDGIRVALGKIEVRPRPFSVEGK